MRTSGSDGSIVQRLSGRYVRDVTESFDRDEEDDGDDPLRTWVSRAPTSSHP